MRILIVAWAWPPIGRVGALRPLGLAREWVEAGHDVHVVTGPGDRGGEYSPDLLEAAERTRARVHRAPAPELSPLRDPRPAFLAGVDAVTARGRVSRLRQILAQWRNFPDYQRSWIPHAFELARRLQHEERFDIVWTTSPPESVHYVGVRLARLGGNWVADFRDQWSEYLLGRWDPISRLAIDVIGRRLLAPAREVTAATNGVATSMRRALGRDVVCIRNGFDTIAVLEEAVRPRTLGYFGRVDPRMQHPERLWPALRQLRAAGRAWKVEFYCVPGGGGGAAIAPPRDLADCVDVRAPLPHADALRAMRAMTALLVLGCETRCGDSAVGGKFYEYVGSGRPLLLCEPRGFEARSLAEELRLGVGAWGENELVAALERLETFAPDPAGRTCLSRKRSAEDLLTIFRRTLRNSGDLSQGARL